MRKERTEDNIEPLWDIHKTAKYLDMNPNVVARKARDRKIPVAGKLGGRCWRFRKSSIDLWLQSNRNK